MPEAAYIDTCVFLEMIQQKNAVRLPGCDRLLQMAKKGELTLVTSSVSITEVNRLPDMPGLPAEQSKQILEFFENEYIAIRAATREVAEVAHELTRTHKLTNLDAIHIATAITSKVPVFYTYDGTKQKRKGLLAFNLKVGNPLLRVEVPPDPFTGTLLDPEKPWVKPPT